MRPLTRPTWPPGRYPPQVAASWGEKVGPSGWISITGEDLSFREGGDGDVGSLPGFRVSMFDAEVIRKMPLPDQPFALYFSGDGQGLTDAGLKSLASMKGLTALGLNLTAVTDAGVKELAAFKQLRWLDLTFTKITAKAAADLAELKQLRYLSVGSTVIGDDELKPLAKLEHLHTRFTCVAPG